MQDGLDDLGVLDAHAVDVISPGVTRIYSDSAALSNGKKRGRQPRKTAGPESKGLAMRRALLATSRLGDRCGDRHARRPLTLTAER
jgi:hypothetical protein